MPLDVTLGLQTWRWHLQDEQPVDEWFRARPWVAQGGALVVQASDDDDVTLFLLRRLVFSADCGSSEVRVVNLEVASDGDVVRPLAAWLAVHVKNERELSRALSEDLAIRPSVFLLDARKTEAATSAAEAVHALVDFATKLDVQHPPTLVLLHRRAYAPLRGRYKLDCGWPMGLARSLIEAPRQEIWRQYVHLRIAWECGGIIDDAYECACHADDLSPESDSDVERMLNRFALTKYNTLASDERRAWERYITGRNFPRPTVAGQTLETSGRMTPFPWLARALVLSGKASGGTLRALRAEINCLPLSEQILTTCFAIESSMRGRLPTEMGVPPEDVQKHYARFAAAGALGRSLEAELYPVSHPAPPHDPWDFASLGHIMNYVKTVAPSERGLFTRIRILRNAAAHCHHLGWRGLLETRDVKAILL